MHHKLLGTAAITILGVLATSGMTSAAARGAHATGHVAASHHTAVSNANTIIGGHIFQARTAAIRTNRGGLGRDDSRDAAILAWPYYPAFGDIPVATSEGPVQPEVIVISGELSATPSRAAPDAGPDYSYVAGCRAIPNGYHCDPPHHDAATH